MKYTDEQGEIIESSTTLGPGECLKAIAFAGTGKSTTLKGVAEALDGNRKGGPKGRGIYLAFNKSIATEAQAKMGHTKCQAKTMHSLAMGTMRPYIENLTNLNARSFKATGIADKFHVPKVHGWGEFRIHSAVCNTMAKFCASADQDVTLDHSRQALTEILGDPDFVQSEERAGLIRDTVELLEEPLMLMAEAYLINCLQEGTYSHDLYLKALDLDEDYRMAAFRGYKYIMVDEAQDINPVQRSIIMATGLPIIAVGDPHQQIYSWRGAENALALLPGKELYLTQSFRFGENVAAQGRMILDSIPSGGPEKRLTGVGPGKFEGVPKGAAICRTNVGMIDEAVRYMQKGLKVHIDNIDVLLGDVRSAEALKSGDMQRVTSSDLKQFTSWEELKMTAEEGNDPGLGKLVGLIEGDRVRDVEDLAKNHIPDQNSANVVVCTGHRSKGLEFRAVQLGEDWQDIEQLKGRYVRAAKKSEKHITAAVEAFNVLYVAATRAMEKTGGLKRILFPEMDDIDAKKVAPQTYEEAAAEGRRYMPEPS